MISGIDLNEVVDFTLKEDKENPTIWKLGAIPSLKLATIAGQSLSNAISQTISVVKLGLRGWENFQVAGKEVEYKSDDNGVLPELLDIIPVKVLTELGNKVLEINKLSEEESKN